MLLRCFDKFQKGPNGNARRALGLVGPNAIRPCRTRDVKMGPSCLIDKFLDKHGTHDGAGLAAWADVFDIGDIRFYLFAIFRADRKLPEPFSCILSMADN